MFRQSSDSIGASFNSICAGTIICYEGELKFISTNSGHYKPAPPALKMYLASLAEEDVDISDVCVFVKDKHGARFLRASTFMNNMRAASDWPDATDQGVFINVGGTRCRVDEPAG